jgi:hypothetical protein
MTSVEIHNYLSEIISEYIFDIMKVAETGFTTENLETNTLETL